MAEALGGIASGISLVQLSGSLLTASLKIRKFVGDVKNVPEVIEVLLDQVDIMIPILSEVDTETSAIPLPPSLDACLRQAALHCHKALQQLECLATEFQVAIKSCRGLKRRLKFAQVVAKKEVLGTCEKRLGMAVQYLSLAQQTCILCLQRIQPEVIVSQVVREIDAWARPIAQSDNIEDGNPEVASLRLCKRKVKRNADRVMTVMETVFEIANPKFLGAIKVERPLKRGEHCGEPRTSDNICSTKEAYNGLCLQLRTPAWLGSLVFDSALQSTQNGWRFASRTHRVWLEGSTGWNLIVQTIGNDDIHQLRHLFQENGVRPLDQLTDSNLEQPYSLLSEAIRQYSWQVAAYLLSLGSDPTVSALDISMWVADDDSMHHLHSFLESDELPDTTRMKLFSNFRGDLASFKSARRRVWPDYEFYSSDFLSSRYYLFKELIIGAPFVYRPPAVLRDALYFHGCVQKATPVFNARDERGAYLPHYLARMIGAYSGSSALLQKCYSIVRHILKYSPFRHYLHKSNACSVTPFLNLLLSVQYSLEWQIDMRWFFSTANREDHAFGYDALRTWLLVLNDSGVDLEDYGRQEKQCLLYSKRYLREFEVKDSCTYSTWMHLISFDYGTRIEDWKLWWSEPTDELVGEFWAQQDPEPDYFAPMPGAWVEED